MQTLLTHLCERVGERHQESAVSGPRTSHLPLPDQCPLQQLAFQYRIYPDLAALPLSPSQYLRQHRFRPRMRMPACERPGCIRFRAYAGAPPYAQRNDKAASCKLCVVNSASLPVWQGLCVNNRYMHLYRHPLGPVTITLARHAGARQQDLHHNGTPQPSQPVLLTFNEEPA